MITTIQTPTPSVREWLSTRRDQLEDFIVVGDRKGPASFDDGVTFLSLEQQQASTHQLANLLPTDHYARKNLGYLEAMARRPEAIYETDDDNAPQSNWQLRSETTEARVVSGQGWANAYHHFTDEPIWPRGYPLSQLSEQAPLEISPPRSLRCPVQQGLCDGSPDVDAIWRLTCDRPITFNAEPSIHLNPGAWCPFNSQNTWWFTQAWPLMYLPTQCSMRMTDIWRSFVAQRCLWELDCGVVFHAPDVVQERNEHDLMSDFELELSGYRHNGAIVDWLSELTLADGEVAIGDNLRACYQCLVDHGVLSGQEMACVDAWLSDVDTLI